MVRLLCLIILLTTSTMVDAAAYRTEPMCKSLPTFPDEFANHELCFAVEVYTPSPAFITLADGTETTEYMGFYEIKYDYENETDGVLTHVIWEDDETSDCNATAMGFDCTSCSICDDGTVEADCTNLEQGRKVECGEVNVREVDYDHPDPFFPFTHFKAMNSSISLLTGTCEVGPDFMSDASCPAGEFCQIQEGICNTKMASFYGVCAPIPMVCAEIFAPVCGCNEIDYASECKAHGAGVSVSRTGECSLDDGNDLTKAEDASMAPTPTELPTDEDTNPVSAPSGAVTSSTLSQCSSVVAIIVTLVLVGGQL